MLAEVVQVALDVVQEQISQVPAETVAHDDALDIHILLVGWQRIGRNLPSSVAKAVGHVIQREARIAAVS